VSYDPLSPPQYGTSMHWPYCQIASCTGCLPPPLPTVDDRPRFDLSLFRRDIPRTR
jgi:hypothetical protein